MRTYRYQRSNFRPRPVRLDHLDIRLSFWDDRVDGVNELTLTAREPLTEVWLDARDLTIQSVSGTRRGEPWRELAFEVLTEQHALAVTLPEPMQAGESFVIRTETTCVPSDHVLEGIYRDTTPANCPPQYMSQCQQWGFQRIVPIIDDCTAKCTMTTTLEGDARYTHLISNGNICRERNPAGRPIPKPGDPSRQVITYDNPVPMAPYLFIACAGTWDQLSDEVVTASGNRVALEYLVPPGRIEGARIPMEILKTSVLWQERTQEYEYKHDVYRTICMEKSNFGGMENVGNTTIVTSAAMMDEWTNDARLKYAYGVIVHEYEHNQCGSDVTMETPFDMWLNEAYTVDVERQFMASQFDPVCCRLDQVDVIRAPVGGPLAIEDAGLMGNIVREGFNDPDELVDGVTYVKAPEVIRMLKLILGDEIFRRARNLYFNRHTGRNANTDDFFACFEEASGRDLSAFRQEWLHRIGYPQVKATHGYDDTTRTLQVEFVQTQTGSGGRFCVPIAWAAVDADGRDIPGTDQVTTLTAERQQVVVSDIPRPAFLSFNRDASFYGTFEDQTSSRDMLMAQVRSDPNTYNRVEAMRRLTDLERVALLENPAGDVSETWLAVWGDLLQDAAIHPGVKAHILTVDEQSLTRSYLPWYRERYQARHHLLAALAERWHDELVAAFEATDTYRRPSDPKDGVPVRQLKGVLLRTLMEANTTAVQTLAEQHFRKAWHITDRVSALHAIQLSDHPNREALLAEAYAAWCEHLNGYTSYLGIIAAAPRDNVFDRIAEEAARSTFNIAHPSHNRALFLPMTSNNKMLWTPRGIAWVADRVIELAPINENSALHVLSCFQQGPKLADDLRALVHASLQRMAADVDADTYPSVAGRVHAYMGQFG